MSAFVEDIQQVRLNGDKKQQEDVQEDRYRFALVDFGHDVARPPPYDDQYQETQTEQNKPFDNVCGGLGVCCGKRKRAHCECEPEHGGRQFFNR